MTPPSQGNTLGSLDSKQEAERAGVYAGGTPLGEASRCPGDSVLGEPAWAWQSWLRRPAAMPLLPVSQAAWLCPHTPTGLLPLGPAVYVARPWGHQRGCSRQAEPARLSQSPARPEVHVQGQSGFCNGTAVLSFCSVVAHRL